MNPTGQENNQPTSLSQSSYNAPAGGFIGDFFRIGDNMTIPGLSEADKMDIAKLVYNKNGQKLPEDKQGQILQFSRIWVKSSQAIGAEIEKEILQQWAQLWTFDKKNPDETKINQAPQSLQVLSSLIHNILVWSSTKNQDILQEFQLQFEFYSQNKQEVGNILNRLKKSDYPPAINQGKTKYYFKKNKDSVTVTTQQDLYVMRKALDSKALDSVESEELFLLKPDGTFFACHRENVNQAIASGKYVPFLTIKTVADYSNPYPDQDKFIVENGQLGSIVSDNNPENKIKTTILAPEMREKFTISIVDHRPTALFRVGKVIVFPFKLLAKIVLGIGRLILWPFKKIGASIFREKDIIDAHHSSINTSTLTKETVPNPILIPTNSRGESSQETELPLAPTDPQTDSQTDPQNKPNASKRSFD